LILTQSNTKYDNEDHSAANSDYTDSELSLLEQMTNANIIYSNRNSVNNQRKQNKHLVIKEDLHRPFEHIGSV